MAEKAVAVLGIFLLGLCFMAAAAAARGGALVEDTAEHKLWNVLDSDKLQPLSDSGDGEVVLADAAWAEVSVVLIDGDGEDPADVFGVLTARIGDSPNEILLFQRSSSEHVPVRPGHLIPLERSVVPGVPLDSHLTIRADLWDYDSLSPNDEIAKGTAHFPARSSGNSNNNIQGRYGEIQVRVIWHAS